LSKSVDIVLQCRRTANDRGPIGTRRLHPIFTVIEVSWPDAICSLAVTEHLPMQAASTVANAGQDVRLLRTYRSASPIRPESHDCRCQSGQRHGDLAILLRVEAGHADLGELSRRSRRGGAR
jgi:hypothetical protein